MFRVAVIENSYVWRQGITNEELFSVNLEKRLNQILKTKVYILGRPSDSILDNYIKYLHLQRNFLEIDVYVFGIEENDPFYQKNNGYHCDFYDHAHSWATEGALSQYSISLKYFDLHPSAVMNTAYARVLYEEIEKKLNLN